MSTKLKLKNISKLYHNSDGDQYALQNINMQVANQEFLAIIGEKGSGKSTLFNILGLLERPSTGAYLIDGKPTGVLNESQITQLREKTFGFLFRALFLNPKQSALRNISLALTQNGTPTSRAKEIASEQLTFLGGEDLQDKKVRDLPIEQQQLVALARALATGNNILLADEPFKPLDEDNQQKLLELFQKIHYEHQKTVIILTEKRQLLAPHSDRVLNLQKKTLKQF